MACGAPVISTDCPSGPAEIIDPEVDGFLVPVGDVAALAEKIIFLLNRPEVRQILGQQARHSAQRFRVNAVLDNYVSALLGDGQVATVSGLNN
jgi:glycosyltransferase involved in cell wall biosynthesis